MTYLEKLIADKLIKVRKHPTEDLFIYNYTQKVQFEKIWNDHTLKARGLILDGQGNVVARPFPKFFNLGERPEIPIPDEPFEIFEKMDGSLGILYWIQDVPHIATRRCFDSEQALKATDMLHGKYAQCIEELDKSLTYLFEIIYPKNRIIVDYGNDTKLVLLATICTMTGKNVPIVDIGFPMVKKYEEVPLKDIGGLKELNENNREGFVLVFQGGLRIKVKFDEYVLLHRILSQVSSTSVWESLKTYQTLDEVLRRLPDEIFQWVKDTRGSLLKQYYDIERIAKSQFSTLGSRKETAQYFKTCDYPSVMFSMLDDKPYDQIIWKMIRPEHERPGQ